MDDEDRAFLLALKRLQLRLQTASSTREQGGIPASTARGRLDFHSHRRYERRDPPRLIDWRVFARTGALVARNFADEHASDLHLLVDVSGSMGLGTPSKLHEACRIALGIAYLGVAADATVSVWTGPAGADAEAPVARLLPRLVGSTGVAPAWQALQRLSAQGPMLMHAALQHWAALLPANAETVVISDFLCATLRPESFSGLDRQRRVTLVQTLAAEDRVPPMTGPVLLEDSETGERRAIQVQAGERRDYSERLAACSRTAQQWCRRHRHHWLVHKPAGPPIDTVRAYVSR